MKKSCCSYLAIMSLCTLKTKLNSLGLHRRSMMVCNEVDNDVLRDRIRRELDSPGNSAGYRSVWHTLMLEGNRYLEKLFD